VTDPAKRRLLRLFPEAVLIPSIQVNHTVVAWASTKLPRLEARWEGDTTWTLVDQFQIDPRHGYVTAFAHVYRYDEDEEFYPYILPSGIRLLCAYTTEGQNVRYPTSGYAGTAFDDFGHEAELRLYDETLPRVITIASEEIESSESDSSTSSTSSSEDDLATWLALVTRLHAAYCDTAWPGGAVIAGIDYEWLRLDRRVNITAVDGDGGAITTGWEAIAAPVTEVEYDYEQRVTTLTFNGDHLQYMLTDVDRLKQTLKIKAPEAAARQVTIVYKSGGRVLATLPIWRAAE
jgi:hypothetical protein